jgi:hypothetical protein
MFRCAYFELIDSNSPWHHCQHCRQFIPQNPADIKIWQLAALMVCLHTYCNGLYNQCQSEDNCGRRPSVFGRP